MSTILNAEGVKYDAMVHMEVIVCFSCGVPFGVPHNLRRNFLEQGTGFYCPNGHHQCYSVSKVEKLKKELEQKQEEIERKNNRIRYWQEEADREKRLAIGQKIQAAKAKNKLRRVYAGVCPCCNRTFQNLAEHMKKKHPGEAEAVIAERIYTEKGGKG